MMMMARQIVTCPDEPDRTWTWRTIESVQATDHATRDGQEVITVSVASSSGAIPGGPLHLRIAPKWRYNALAVHRRRTTTRYTPADPRAYLTLHECEALARASRCGPADQIMQVLNIQRAEGS